MKTEDKIYQIIEKGNDKNIPSFDFSYQRNKKKRARRNLAFSSSFCLASFALLLFVVIVNNNNANLSSNMTSQTMMSEVSVANSQIEMSEVAISTNETTPVSSSDSSSYEI